MYTSRVSQLPTPLVWTALVTPLLENHKIDFEGMGTLMDQQAAAGNGILCLGSTGEALNLSFEEKCSIVDFFKQNKPQTLLMCGVGGFDMDATSQWIQKLNTYPFDAYLLLTPPYAKPGDKGQSAWFLKLLDIADKPCFLYNIPGRGACRLSLKALETLAGHPNFAGIKESGGSLASFQAYKKAIPNHLLYCGDDALMPEAAKHGACGLFSVASNAWPEQVHTFVQQCLDATFKDHALWNRAAQSLFSASNPIPIKRLLHDRQLIASPAVKTPLSAADMGSPEVLQRLDLDISAWKG